METLRGKDRTVYVLGSQVYKRPNSEPELAAESLYDAFLHGGVRRIQKLLECDVDVYQSPKYYLFHGVIANRREAVLAKEFPDIVVRTHSIGAGLLNIQPLVSPIPASMSPHIVFANHMEGGVHLLGHMIENPSNFGICDDGRVRFVDGGSYGLEKALRLGKRSHIQTALSELIEIQ